MKEKDRYILLSIVLFVEILALITFVFCGGDMGIKKILCFLVLNTVISGILLLILFVANIAINRICGYTGETVHISKEDLHYRCNFESAQEIYIAKDVVNIPYKHFYKLKNLQCIVFEGENTTISENAFEECEKLERVYLPSKLEKIRENTFKNCDKLEEITIPDSVTKIGAGAFAGCKGLTSVTIGNGVKEIEKDTFSGCDKVETLVIGDGLTSLDNLPITPALKSIVIGNGVTKINNCRFCSCTNLISVELGKNVTEIGVRTFRNCKILKSVTIPESVTKIGENAFIECEELESVEFKDVKNLWKVGLESIEVSKPMENAKKLKESNYNWYKETN